MGKEFSEKVILVTGGASGIGRASALLFAERGASVVVSDIEAASGEAVAREIRHAGGEAVFVRADVSNSADVTALVGETMSLFGRIDGAHNNAGIEGTVASTIECTEDDWDRVIAINLKGIWLCMKHELTLMLRQGHGAIVNTSSVAGLVGPGAAPAYTASKHGVVGLTRNAAVEYASMGIRVNAVCPGLTETGMYRRLGERGLDLQEAVRVNIPIRRTAQPREIAEAAVWLCSDAASYVTGHIMVIDGGETTR